ncbi:hypothetical protein ACFX2B_011222 [Malus domestica]
MLPLLHIQRRLLLKSLCNSHGLTLQNLCNFQLSATVQMDDMISVQSTVQLSWTQIFSHSSLWAQPPQVGKVQPYPRKFEGFIMSRIKNITLTSRPQSPSCKVQHNVSALVFSAGGYTGNFFHDFDDGFVPLFITVNTIFPDQDIVIVVSEAPYWWPSRFCVYSSGSDWDQLGCICLYRDSRFGRGARSLNLEYSEYKIGVNESSLVDKYGKENFLLKDPSALLKKGWPSEFMKIYIKEQNVKLDLERFKSCLKEAYTKAKRFVDKNG